MGHKFLNFEVPGWTFAIELSDMSSSGWVNAFDSGVQGMKGNICGALPGGGCGASTIRDLQEFRQTSVRSHIGLADRALWLLDGLGDSSKSFLILKDQEREWSSGWRRSATSLPSV